MKTLNLLLGLTICIVGNSRADEKPLQKAIQIPLHKHATPKQILAQIPLNKTEEIPSSYSFYDGNLKHNVWLIFKQPTPGKNGVDQMFVFDEKKKAKKILYHKQQVFSSISIEPNAKLFYLNSKTKKGIVLDAMNSALYAFPNGIADKQMFPQMFNEYGHGSNVISYYKKYIDTRGFLRIIQQTGDYDGTAIRLYEQSSWFWNGKEWKFSDDRETISIIDGVQYADEPAQKSAP